MRGNTLLPVASRGFALNEQIVFGNKTYRLFVITRECHRRPRESERIIFSTQKRSQQTISLHPVPYPYSIERTPVARAATHDRHLHSGPAYLVLVRVRCNLQSVSDGRVLKLQVFPPRAGAGQMCEINRLMQRVSESLSCRARNRERRCRLWGRGAVHGRVNHAFLVWKEEQFTGKRSSSRYDQYFILVFDFSLIILKTDYDNVEITAKIINSFQRKSANLIF
jgi:hypothetical protein